MCSSMDFTYIFISLPLHTVCFIGTLLRWFPQAQVKSLFLCEVSLFPSSLALALSVPIDPLSAPNHSLNCSLLPGKRSPRKPSFYKGEKLRELYNSFKNVAVNRDTPLPFTASCNPTPNAVINPDNSLAETSN